MTERVGANLRQPLNDFPRKPRHARKRKVGRNPPAFVTARSLDLALLPSNITRVLDGRFGARDINLGAIRIDLQRDLATVQQLRRRTSGCRSRWLAGTRSPDPVRTIEQSSADRLRSNRWRRAQKPLPSLVVHQTRHRARAA